MPFPPSSPAAGPRPASAVVMALRRLAALVRKEFLVVLKDPANRMILILPVVVQSLVFGYAATYDLREAPYVVVDAAQGHGPSASRLLALLDGTGVFRRVATVTSPEEAARRIDRGDAVMAVMLPPDLDRTLQAGGRATVLVALDGRNSTTAGTAALYLQAVVARFEAELRAAAGLPVAGSVRLETRAWFNPNLETRWNFLPALAASLSLLQTLTLTALSVAREREQGTFDQLLVTPLQPLEIMVAKALPPMLIGLVQSSLVLLVARWWFQVPMAGSPVVLGLCLATFVLAAVGLGLSISAVSRTMQQAMLITFVLVMPMMLLSGLSTPIDTMPHALQVMTQANPLRYGIDAVRRVYLEDAALSTLLGDLLPLLAIAGLTAPAAAWLFRHRLT